MALKETLAQIAFNLDRDKPEILLAVGIGGIVVGTIFACRATLKAPKIVEEHNTKMLSIREHAALEDQGKLKTQTVIHTSMEFVKTYAPSVLVIGLGIAAICFSHHILSERNAALSAALTATSAAFLEYRDRVKKEVGEEVEQMIFDGGHKEKIEVTEFDGKKEKTHEEEIVIYDKPPAAPYSILFDGKSRWWRENCPMANRIVCENVQKNANIILHGKGFITLAEVLEMLGFELDMKNDIHAKEYLQMGWRDSSESEPMKFVDLGLDSPRLAEFGKSEDCAWLTFNVDPAPIWHTAGTKMGSLVAA